MAFFLTAQCAAAKGTGLVFVADPLDGTTNFLHGVPWYAVSIAALLDGVVVAGAIINASTGELFTATLGGGARRAGEAMRVSATTEPSRSWTTRRQRTPKRSIDAT